MAESVQEPAAQIKVTKDGPLIIQGNCALMGSDGRELERCGPLLYADAADRRTNPTAMERIRSWGSKMI